ncbi:RHS repeat-associated core domain-containing protein [Streptomyces microflavus]|uniref:RHS repeat-associated core domain-containing protein n=1 Tax=Streptomyces microflavus TaxID=1919 RepID=UPI003645FAF1
MTSAWGAKLTVTGWSGTKVTFVSPKRWGQHEAPKTAVELREKKVKAVIDPLGKRTAVEWTTHGDQQVVVPSAVVSPTGARTEFGYRQYEERSGGIVAVSKIEVKGSDGETLIKPVTVDLDPSGANGGRSWTGCPQYCSDGTDRLENSGDGSFTYAVRFSQATGQQVEHTYNALHLKKSEISRVKQGSQAKDVLRTEYSYPGETADGAPPKAKDAPATYQMPTGVEVTTIDPADASRTKKSRTSAEFDTMGRQTKAVQGTVETTTEYGEHSIPLRTQTRDTSTGARRAVENTPSQDGKAVARTVTKAADGGGELKPVSTEEFEYHDGDLAGEVKKATVTGDPSAADGALAPAVTSTETTIDKDADGVGRRTDTVTGSDGVKTVTVSDLAGGYALSTKSGDLGEATTTYDLGDQPVQAVTSDGTVTTSVFETHEGGSSTTSTRASDGYATRTETDDLGNTTLTATNFKPSSNNGQGEILPPGQWRNTSTTRYDGGRPVATTDADGRETTTEYDAWGIPFKVTSPNGSTAVSTHDDVAGTTTSSVTPTGAEKPTVTSTQNIDDLGNLVRTEISHGDGAPGSINQTRHNAFGEATHTDESTSPFTMERAYTPSGAPKSDNLTPRHGDGGSAAVSRYEQDAFGNRTRKTLEAAGTSVKGWKTSFDKSGRPVEVSLPGDGGTTSTVYNRVNGLAQSATHPDGSMTHQRHDAAGRVVERWSSSRQAPETKNEHVHTTYDTVTGLKSAEWFDGDETASKVTYTYFADGQLQERTDPGGKKTAYTYTDGGELATVTDHTGAVTTHGYDPTTGLVSKVEQERDGRELARVSYTYDAAGRLAGIDRGNGAVSFYTYNDAGLPTDEKHTRPGGETAAEHTYTYSADRRLDTSTGTIDGRKTATAYTYDAEGRLTQSLVTEGDRPREGAFVQKSEYAFDIGTNLAEKKITTPGPEGQDTTTVTAYEHDPASHTTRITTDGKAEEQTYDDAGRLTRAADGTRHTYNTSGQLTQTIAPDGVTLTHTYNPAGEHATQTTARDGKEHTITYHPGTETDQDGTTAGYLAGGTLEARTITPAKNGETQTSYYLTNRHGDKTGTFDDSSDSTQYTDFGTPRTAAGAPLPVRAGAITENPYGYAGEYTTPTGHQILGTRWYDPNAAAFTTPDTPTAGMLNPYTYATGDPVNHTDPTGQSPEDAWNWFQNSWFNREILSWEGMPYVDMGLAVAGTAAAAFTFFTGGAGAPLAFALIGLAATVPSAADQIARHSNPEREGFLSDSQRTGLGVLALAGGLTGGVAGASGRIKAGIDAGIREGRAAMAKLQQIHRGTKSENQLLGLDDLLHPASAKIDRVHSIQQSRIAMTKAGVTDKEFLSYRTRPSLRGAEVTTHPRAHAREVKLTGFKPNPLQTKRLNEATGIRNAAREEFKQLMMKPGSAARLAQLDRIADTADAIQNDAYAALLRDIDVRGLTLMSS